jgi:formylglycine-generating enzyme required for sulfatase activity
MGSCEVLNEQYARFDPRHDSRFEDRSSWIFSEEYLGWPLNQPRQPVVRVSWNQAMAFCQWLSKRTGECITLPTEAQWEYACRAGTATPWSFGQDDIRAGDYAWLGGNSGGATHPVGGRKPNPWGLYDMHGNVWEWCADWYEKHAYAGGEATDPSGPAKSEGRILRGGAWGEHPNNARSALRNTIGPDGRHNGTGLRCVMLVPQPERSSR